MAEVRTVKQLESETAQQLQSLGVEPDIAALVSRSLIYADARGTRSHGLNMLPAYLERISGGGIDPNARPAVLREDTVSLLLDGRNGFGQFALYTLHQKMLEKIKHNSIVCGSIRNINHCGTLAFFTEQAAAEGFIAFLFVNANPTVAPFGGMEAVLGTNPISIALPCPGRPIVLDMASSAVAKAKIYRAAKLGEPIDPSWALDENGIPTDDPKKAINGVLNAMAGPKGYGIALAVEALAGVLSGGGITDEVLSVHKRTDKGMNAGAFMILINPAAFLETNEYDARINRLADQIKSSKPQPGKTIFLPGEIEREALERSLSDGIEY